jgi:TonB family protein
MLLATTLLLVFFALNSASGFQGADARDSGKPNPTPTPKSTTSKGPNSSSGPKSGGKGVNPAAPSLQMTIIAPPGCRIWINEVPIETSLTREMVLLIGDQKVKTSERVAGVIALKGIRPGTYRLTARKPDFNEYATSVTVAPDSKNEFTVTLTPTPGKLTVSPSVNGAEIEIVNLETNNSVGRYPERLDQFELAPGRYRVATSKADYKVAIREIRVNPGESVYLEPLLEALPRPTPTPTRPPFIAPISLNVQRQDKYLLFYLQGSSGGSNRTLGSITISLNGPASNTVTGNFNGLPCQIELIKLENIAEASIIEAPSPANNWASMVVRVRPKDEKRRPISFAINWRSLPNPPPIRLEPPATGFIAAQAIRKVQPEYPSAARGSNASGSVLVLVTIDSDGSVISSKAIEGPMVFRRASEEAARKWKFRPATRDGQAIESEQTIQFRYEP